jgi:hypothetical protein
MSLKELQDRLRSASPPKENALPSRMKQGVRIGIECASLTTECAKSGTRRAACEKGRGILKNLEISQEPHFFRRICVIYALRASRPVAGPPTRSDGPEFA